MAASSSSKSPHPSHPSSPSASAPTSKRQVENSSSSQCLVQNGPNSQHDDAPCISVDTLVSHLLAAKRSLSSMTLVLRANELATAARTALEDRVVLQAQTAFVRNYAMDQIALLVRLRRGLHATHEWGYRDFRKLIRAMDDVDAQLTTTMDSLRATEVLEELRPKPAESTAEGTNEDAQEGAQQVTEGAGGTGKVTEGTEGADGHRRNLLDFVDETGVHAMRDSMKKSVEELQGIQQSFDGDMVRFEMDIRNLQRIAGELRLAPPSLDSKAAAAAASDEAAMTPLELLLTMDDHASAMADLLASLNKHFDMCVTAVRTTEGAAALARRRAAEATQSRHQAGPDASTSSSPSNDGGVSISGVIAAQESHMSSLEPESAQDRAEMLRIVVQDAGEVDDVVAEIHQRLAAVQRAAALLIPSTPPKPTKQHLAAVVAGLTDMADSRLAAYIAADDDFRARWEIERDSVVAQVQDMRATRDFYDRYATAYASFVLELERRRGVERQMDAIWQKARDATDKLLAADREARDAFRAEVGEFLPTDLWAGAQRPARSWKLVPADEEDESA